MRFKKLITPLLITVIICATLALGYQQDPLLRLPNPFSGAGQTLKKDDQSAEVKALYSRITNLESKVYLLEKRILPNRLPNPFSGAGQTLKKDDQSAERITNLESKVSRLEKRILPFRLLNPFSGAGQTLKKYDQSAERITNLESKVSRLEKRIEELEKQRVIPANQK
jgi:outer membrane murein-binding lipoprotein Lpp